MVAIIFVVLVGGSDVVCFIGGVVVMVGFVVNVFVSLSPLITLEKNLWDGSSYSYSFSYSAAKLSKYLA